MSVMILRGGDTLLARKEGERATAEDPAAPFVDRDGYLAYVEGWEESFSEMLAAPQRPD